MLVTINGLPGGNKSALRDNLAAALKIPNLPPTSEDAAIHSAAVSGDPSRIALANIAFHASAVAPTGVRKGSVAQTDAYFGLLFEPTSTLLAATTQRLVQAQLGWSENVRVLVNLSPEQSLHLAPKSGLSIEQLTELKMAEAAPLPPHCKLIMVHGPSTSQTALEIKQQLCVSENITAKFL